jgi:undecaprenyl diphosphate synthase
MDYKHQIKKERLPRHIAIIMDGNGRWAKKLGMMQVLGHKQGVNVVREITEEAAQLGIQYLTLYAFSTENWNRPKEEVDALMSLLVNTIVSETDTLMKNNVQLLSIGDLNRLPNDAKRNIQDCIAKTSSNTGLKLVIALSYSARWEIIQAVKNIAQSVKNEEMQIEQIDEQVFSSALTTKEMPDPDLLIRTSGELRISNFLLWQLAYAELYFTDCLWPEFTKEEFYKAIVEYQGRERRFGKTSEQI